MDAAQALAELTELSSQIERAVVLDADGSVLALHARGCGRCRGARASRALELARRSAELRSPPQDGHTRRGRARRGRALRPPRGGRTIAATTGPSPTVGLVVYDLRRACSGSSEPEKPKRRRPAREPEGGATSEKAPPARGPRRARDLGLAVARRRPSAPGACRRLVRGRLVGRARAGLGRRSSASPPSPVPCLAPMTRRGAWARSSSSGRCWRATSSSAPGGAPPGTSTSTASRPSRRSCAPSATRLARGRERVRAGGGPARRAGSRRGRVGRFGIAGVRAALHHRAR